MKQKVLLAQPNYKFGDNVYIPYSVGRLWAYGKTKKEIEDNYEIDFLYLREDIDVVIKKRYDVLCVSCYIWNWGYCKRLMQEYKNAHTDCLVVAGGAQIPNNSDEFMDSHPYIDLVVRGEGEQAFVDILFQKLSEYPTYEMIHGVTTKTHHGGIVRHSVLDFPSPYLSGVFDHLVSIPYSWQAPQETARGCPYHCAFCSWGGVTASKVVQFDIKDVLDEIDWFSQKGITLVYNCDANFGIYKRDMDIIAKIVNNYKEFGFPTKFRAAYDKHLTGRVFEMSKMLNDAGISKGTTLSFQSLHGPTLRAISRKNMTKEESIEVIKKYTNAGMPTYTEFIIGLPLETYNSFMDGIEFLLDVGLHYGLIMYMCVVLSNTELADKEYQNKYGIKTTTMHQLLLHGIPDSIDEFYEVITETNTMSHTEWRKVVIFSWVIQAFHSGGFTDLLAIDARRKGLSYRRFYEIFITYGEQSYGVIGKEFRWINQLLSRVLSGGKWETNIPLFGNITWPPEEATMLRLALVREEMYREMSMLINDPGLIEKQKERSINPLKYKDLEEFAREEVWYARRGKKTQLEQIV